MGEPAFTKVTISHLPFLKPPLPMEGGRVATPAGELAQIINGEILRHIVYLEFLPASQPRGRHYHQHKTEILYILTGTLQALFQDITSKEQLEVTLQAGDMVRVSPQCAHQYRSGTYAQALELAAQPYDPTDTIAYAMTLRKDEL